MNWKKEKTLFSRNKKKMKRKPTACDTEVWEEDISMPKPEAGV